MFKQLVERCVLMFWKWCGKMIKRLWRRIRILLNPDYDPIVFRETTLRGRENYRKYISGQITLEELKKLPMGYTTRTVRRSEWKKTERGKE